MTAVITTERLSRWYGQVIALNDVSVTIEQGIVGLLGPNGAGKSTFLRLVVGLMRPTSGALRVLGAVPADEIAWRRRFGYCPEHDNFYEDMTGLEFVETFARLSGFAAGDARRAAAKTLDRVRLAESDYAKKQIRQYSKGMRQKVKIAQALVHEPELVVLDEPLTGADPVSRHEINELLKELGRAGHTVVVSSHVLHEVERVTQRFILIDKGRLLAEGTVGEIRALIDKHPHRIELSTPDPRGLAARLVAEPTVVSVNITESGLTLETREADGCYAAIGRLAGESGIPVLRMVSPDNNLDAVFRYLTRG